jgi:PAS domain S-box-containing protein
MLIGGLLIQRANLQRAEQRFRQALRAAPNGMLMVRRDGIIVFANTQTEILFGYGESEMVGKPVEILVPEALRAEHVGHRDSYLKAPESRAMGGRREFHGRRKNGTEVPVEIVLSPLETYAGLLILVSVIDLTERRQAEEGLRTSQRQLRQLSGRLIGAQETERRRIARELHDDFNQSLALLSVEMDILRRKLPESAEELGPRVEELCARVRQLSSSIHELSHELHPLKLEQLGLVAAIRGLCKEMSESHDLAIEFIADGVPDGVSADTALCLYRVVQESLRNVIKHSRAKDACVTLSGTVNEICLRIVDNGAGFDARSVVGRGGLGLISMRERLRLVGGKIAIDAHAARGTQIDVRVPLRPTAPADLHHTSFAYDGIVDSLSS